MDLIRKWVIIMEPKTLESFLSDVEYLREAEELLKKIYYRCHDGNKLNEFFKQNYSKDCCNLLEMLDEHFRM